MYARDSTHTLWSADHDLADKDSLPQPCAKLALYQGAVTTPTDLMVVEVFVKAQVFPHLYTLHDRHP